jgi:hypothetical protein
MYSNQPPPLYTTRHYIHDPQSNSGNNNNVSYNQSRGPPVQPYPYYTNNQGPSSVTYVNDRPNYGQQQQQQPPPQYHQQQQQQPQYHQQQQQQQPSYVPPNTNRYPPTNTQMQSSSPGPAGGGRGRGAGGIDKTNMMSNGSPFNDPARSNEQYNTPRTITSITNPPKGDGGLNKSLNLSDENPFHTVYGGYHYPSQIDPSKRITTQNTANRSTENKSLNLSDESPFFSTYGRYHYPSQIDPQKRITEMPKAAAALAATNDMSENNPFNNYQQPPPREYSSQIADWNRNNPAPPSYRPVQTQQPPPNHYNQQEPPSFQPPNPPHYQQQQQQQQPPASVRTQSQKPNSSGPQDKTSLNMSPDNPFSQSYGQHHYPSSDEIRSQKKSNERNARFAEQQPVNNNRTAQPSNQMSEYPEAEKSDVTSGKGNSKFTSFEVNF